MKPGPTTATVITLTTTPDRLAAFMAGWAAAGAPLPLNVHCSPLAPDPMKGCFDAHVATLTASEGPLLVLEDDAVFAPEFTLEMEWPDDADLYYLGGEHQLGDRIRRTHGYVAFDPPGLVDKMTHPARPIPMLPSRRHPHIDTILNRVPLVRYAASPFTIGQRGGLRSSIQGTIHAEDRYWND